MEFSGIGANKSNRSSFAKGNNDGSSSSRSSSFKERSTSFKQKLLDATNSRRNTELMSEFSTTIRFASEERLKEIAEMKHIRAFQRRLKCCSYFNILFSFFILINACIGFSSAPFYLPNVNCSIVEPDSECLYLKQLTSFLYFIELFGALLMVIHGLLTIALVDHIKQMLLIKIIIKYTKIVFILYLVLIVFRVGVYIKVHYEVTLVDVYNQDQGFGNFLASYITTDKIAATVITCVLMGLFVLCFLCNCITLRLVNKIQEFVLNPNKDEQVNVGINSVRQSVLSDEEIQVEVKYFLCFKRKIKQKRDSGDIEDASQSLIVKQ